MTENEIAKIVVDTCYQIHTKLGAGLFESVYEEVLCYELEKRELNFSRQKTIPVIWNEVKLEIGFRADIIVENKVVLEIKSIEQVASIHQKQLLTYLKLTNLKLGLLINFNTPLIKDGIQRIVNKL